VPDQQLQFADFRLDIESGELRQNGRVVPLERQPAIVLARLAASAGQLVTREDLAAAIWGTDTHVNFDDGLNYCIRQIRAALGDDPKSPQFIATIPRRGYRFIAAVTAAPQPARRSMRSAVVAAGVAAALALIAMAESRSNNHHEIAVSLARSIHDAVF